MKRRVSRWLAALAAATMGTMLDTSCTTGDPPEDGDHCWFICKAVEESQTAPLSEASLSFLHRPVAGPDAAMS